METTLRPDLFLRFWTHQNTLDKTTQILWFTAVQCVLYGLKLICITTCIVRLCLWYLFIYSDNELVLRVFQQYLFGYHSNCFIKYHLILKGSHSTSTGFLYDSLFLSFYYLTWFYIKPLIIISHDRKVLTASFVRQVWKQLNLSTPQFVTCIWMDGTVFCHSFYTTASCGCWTFPFICWTHSILGCIIPTVYE